MKNVPGNVMQERCEYILSHLQVNFRLSDIFSCYEIRFYECDLSQGGK